MDQRFDRCTGPQCTGLQCTGLQCASLQCTGRKSFFQKQTAQREMPAQRLGSGGRLLLAAGFALLMIMQLYSPVAAAEFAAADDVYILPEGQVINDDLYVAAREIVINGTVDGDLLAAGAYIEVNGAVNGSFMGAAAGVRVNGVVQNSARIAAMSVILDGTVRKDFLATAGIAAPGFADFPIPMGTRTLSPGVDLRPNSAVAGDVFLSGGAGRVAGVIGGDLIATLAQLDLGGHTEGNAEIRAETLQVQDATRIGGALTYATRSDVRVGDETAAAVTAQPWPETQAQQPAPTSVNPLWSIFGWLWRTAIQLIGLGLLAWLLWSFAPHLLRRPVDVMEARPVEAGLYGFVAVVVILPLIAALIFLGVLFWGWFPGGVYF